MYNITSGGKTRNIEFEISNGQIRSVVTMKVLVGRGSYFSGIYEHGDVCAKQPDRRDASVRLSARIIWLNSSKCDATLNRVLKDIGCRYSFYVCPDANGNPCKIHHYRTFYC